MSRILNITGTTALHWFKATRSNSSSSCVEVAFTADGALIRDSKYLRDPDNHPAQQPILRVPAGGWADFLKAVENRASEGSGGFPFIAYDSEGDASISDGVTTLVYTPPEWEAFHAGVLDGEFDRIAVAVGRRCLLDPARESSSGSRAFMPETRKRAVRAVSDPDWVATTPRTQGSSTARGAVGGSPPYAVDSSWQ
ncbi:DUF397 domain-containing protein [Nocardia sp. SYP-A9097]|uniref:DUF397 domain-containing protein n=1 Tax=Nocardia sp. SYP-A9097 TaxID=2663237 RepID=UPI00129A1397|nr:DUF397 domain-containing protein [Nocardia sp. SYP-A9097]MRH87329.1 DUF397 domain-containing protein [Nocardia sp. SYP-A9097]